MTSGTIASWSSAKLSASKHKHSYAPRDGLDFYVEPPWCTELLLSQTAFKNVWDPASGRGTIIGVCRANQIAAWGSDIVLRLGAAENLAPFAPLNFLSDKAPINFEWTDIVTNPPYGLAKAFIERAFELRARKIAVLVRLDFLAGDKRCGRNTLFNVTHPPTTVFVLSRRPSMPPGELLAAGKVEQKGGQHDYCWIVWDNERESWPTEVRWLK